MQSAIGNFGKGVLSAVIVFIATYGGALIGSIPVTIGHITLVSVLAGIVAWAQHSVATPAGSRVVKP